ncbi:gag-pol polyprotein, partial [Trifolium medium]|nr:gag-pol polyprotein [Trifolium medium]
MNTTCYIHNRVTLRTSTSTTLYELWKNKKLTVKYFHVFGSKCYILADREHRRKMYPKRSEDDSTIDQVTDVKTDVIASDQQLQKNHPKELIIGNPDQG